LKETGRDLNYLSEGEDLELLCTDAVLPGNSLATHDVTSDYHGVTEKMAYRRIYDESLDLTFYVDSSYKIIEFFDGWIDYITGVGRNISREDTRSPYINYRMQFPKTYKHDIFLTKFEKDRNRALYYTFIHAFPTNIVSMPVSYEASNILKCTVSFSYIRYVRTRSGGSYASSSRNPNSPGNPEVRTETARERGLRLNAANYLTPNSDALVNQRVVHPFNLRGYGSNPTGTTELGGPQQA